MTGLECQGCHRRLKNPSPTGYGPTCARKLGLTNRSPAVRRPKPATVAAQPAVDVIPGQTALDLQYLQPTLGSL